LSMTFMSMFRSHGAECRRAGI